jgi:hypothetical protein
MTPQLRNRPVLNLSVGGRVRAPSSPGKQETSSTPMRRTQASRAVCRIDAPEQRTTRDMNRQFSRMKVGRPELRPRMSDPDTTALNTPTLSRPDYGVERSCHLANPVR